MQSWILVIFRIMLMKCCIFMQGAQAAVASKMTMNPAA